MEKDRRIETIVNSPKTGEVKSIKYKDQDLFEVQAIPLNALLYNRYNGRIRSAILSYESIFGELNPENEVDKKIIEQYLFDSARNRNERTIESLEEKGQQEIGIVTKDGVIIDGNRRALLINKINAEKRLSMPFKAIVLPDELQANERDIILLETNYQMGVDSKVEYNPIEKYLRCKELRELHNFSPSEISDMMAETESTINEWLNILLLMEDYLQYVGTPYVYTRLEKREGHFVDLSSYLRSYLSGKRSPVKWHYQDDDVRQMKEAYFDYIRLGVSVQRARSIGKTGASNSFFCQQDIWNEFIGEHKTIKAIVTEKDFKELRKADPEKSQEDIVRGLDAVWKERIQDQLLENLSSSEIALKEVMELHAPAKILRRVLNSLGQVDLAIITDPQQRQEVNRSLLLIKEKVNSMLESLSNNQSV